MEDFSQRDYGGSGLTVSQAFVHQHKEFKKHKRTIPNFLFWNGYVLKTIEKISIPTQGKIICEIIEDIFVEKKMNGFDLKLESGFLILRNGDKLSHLRTWSEPEFETKLEYEFEAEKNSYLYIWNISKIYLENGKIIEGKWTDNASFQIKKRKNKFIFYCNHSSSKNLDFKDFIFSIKII